MSEWFHVGQKVVCVDDTPFGPLRSYGTGLPVVGRVYTVRRVAIWANWKRTEGGLGLWLDEFVRPLASDGREHPFSARRFRPLRTTDISIFQAMLVTPPKEAVDA